MSSLDIFTSSHPIHDQKWCVDSICTACLIELLEDSDQPQVKKKVFASEFLRLLNEQEQNSRLALLFQSDDQVTFHTALLIIGMLSSNTFDESFESLLIEVTVQLVCLVRSDELANFVLESIAQQCVRTSSCKNNLSLFNLTGRLLNELPNLASSLLLDHCLYIDHLTCGLAYPDNDVQISISYICIQLYTNVSTRSHIAKSMTQHVAQDVVKVLHSTSVVELHINLLGLMKVMLEESSTHQIFLTMTHETDAIPLMLIFKKLLLSHNVVIQIAVVQCLIGMLNGPLGNEFAECLLQADVAEFLFEVLNSTNDLLIRSVYCALLLLTECQVFFERCHAIYGIESVLRSLDYVLKVCQFDTVQYGFNLLANVFQRHSSGIRLFGNIDVLNHCLDLISRGLELRQSESLLQSIVKALKHLLRYDHLLSPIPFKEIASVTEKLIHRLKNRMVKTKTSSEIKHQMLEMQRNQVLGDTVMLNAVILQLARLVCVCCKEPVLDDSAFCGPSPDNPRILYTFKDFCLWLLKSFDEVCLPISLASINNTLFSSSDSSYIDLFTGLLLLFENIPKESHKLDPKLIESGFIELLLGRMVNCRTADLKDIIVLLICEILDYNVVDKTIEVKETLLPVIKSGLNKFHGKLDDVIEEFLNSYERDENRSQSSFYDIGLALIFLLFSCYFHGNRCIGPVRLQSTVLTFLRLQQSRSELPLCIVKCSTYLLAVACSDPEDIPVSVDSSSLVSVLQCIQDCSTVEMWCIESTELLNWGFSDESVEKACGKQLLLHFLDRGFQKDIGSLASKNIACLKALVSLLTGHDDPRIVLMSSDIIKSMLSSFSTENGPCGRAVLLFLDSFIPDTLQRTFLLPDKRLSVSNLSVFLSILTFLQKCHTDGITVQDLKLASYVLAILKPEEFYRFLKDESLLKLLDNSIIYFNALLVKSVQHEDDRTAILLATNFDFMTFLNLAINAKLEIDLIGEKVLFCASLLVAVCISSSSFKTSNRLCIDLDNLLLNKHTNTKSQLPLVTRLFFWSLYCINLQSGSEFITINCRKEKLNSEKKDGLPFNINLVRSVYIAAQNCAMMENEITSNTAVNCLTGIFDLVDGFVDIKHHFQNQAWNQFLLDMVLVRCSCSGQPGASRHVPTSQLRLCSLLLSRAPDLFLHQKRLDSLLGYFCLMSAGSLTVEHQAIWIQIVNQIIGRNDTKTCDAGLVEKAKAKIQEIEEVTVQENAYSFIQLATIIHQMLPN